MPSPPLPKLPGEKFARPLFVTITSVLLIIIAVIVLVLLVVGGFVAGVVVSSGALIMILVLGLIGVVLQLAAAVGMLMMRRWAYWLVLAVLLMSLITPVRELIGGDFILNSWLGPVFLGIVFGYLHSIKKMLR